MELLSGRGSKVAVKSWERRLAALEAATALSRDEIFKIGIDVVMTDSMRFCDVVLPAASHFEFDDIYTAYGHSYLQRAEPVIPTVAEEQLIVEFYSR